MAVADLIPGKEHMSRTASIERKTAETNIRLKLNLDGTGQADIATGVGFFDHMLTLFAKHSATDLSVHAEGDLHVDQHHTVEDVGICLGQTLKQAVGDKAGIRRYGHFTLPMDETLATVAIADQVHEVLHLATDAAGLADVAANQQLAKVERGHGRAAKHGDAGVLSCRRMQRAWFAGLLKVGGPKNGPAWTSDVPF